MKRTTLMTILAMSLALGASRADIPTGTNKPEEHGGPAKWIQIGAEGVIAGNNPDEKQPVRLRMSCNCLPSDTLEGRAWNCPVRAASPMGCQLGGTFYDA